jgi:hypothetical protein
MAIDLEALVTLQKRRSQRAMDALSACEALRREADLAAQRAIQRFQEMEANHAHLRDERIRSILKEPTSVVSLARIRLQYDVGEDELAVLAQDILDRRKAAAEAVKRVEEAKLVVNACMKREKKLEEAASRVARGLAQLQDVQAEMEER